MSTTTALAVYFLIWWVTLFAVLPFGVRPQLEESEPGTDPGAPMRSGLAMKLVWTTIVSAVIFGICWWIYVNRVITLDDMIRWLGLPE